MKRLLNALLYSMDGLKAAYQDEPAFRQEVWLLGIAAGLLFLLPLGWAWSLGLLAGHLLVCAIELLNSAIEAVVDLASPEHHPLAKKAKDCGSAAVLLVCILLAVGWLAAISTLLTR